VAVVQLDYHPAAIYDGRAIIEDPLGDLRETLAVPEDSSSALLERRSTLRQRIREAYVDSLVVKLRAILRACAGWGVEVLVFPEYSIPWQALERVAAETAVAPGMIVVAGTHAVSRDALKDGVYERLGWLREQRPALLTAVAPVLRGGGLLGLVGKLAPNKDEDAGRSFKASRAWTTVQMGDDLGSLAVLICIDFLYREHPSHREIVASDLAQARLCAVPSLTPWHSQDEFAATGKKDAERYDRPVLLANIAKYGGSTIFNDDDPKAPKRAFPWGIATLDPGEEGVVVADVDLGFTRPRSSTSYDTTRPVRPYAAASLVHRHTAELDEYATWAQDFLSRFEQGDAELEQAIEELESAKPLLMHTAELPGAPTRTKRLRRLFDDLGNLDIDRIRELTREIVLPGDALPLPLVRRGLAHGARQVVLGWRQAHEIGLEAALQRLSEALGAQPNEQLLPATESALSDLAARVRRGEGNVEQDGDERRRLAATIKAFIGELSVDGDEIARKLEAGRFHEVEDELRRRISTMESVLGAGGPVDQETRARLHEQRIQLVGVLLNQQRSDDAQAILDEIDPDGLNPGQQARLARAWAAVEEPARARAVLERIPNEARPGDFLVTAALISIAEAQIPSLLPDDARVLGPAAWLHLRQGAVGEAARLAMQALRERSSTMFALGPFVLLTQALHASVWEHPWVLTPIPVERRTEVIETIEKLRSDCLHTWMEVAQQPNAERLASGLEAAVLAYQEAIEEIDPWPELPSIGEENAKTRRRAIQLAEQGDIEAALDLFGPADHPWVSELRRAQLLLVGGRLDEARAASLSLSARYPNRGPVERLTATVLYEARDYDRALEHAKRACEQAPAGGYRYLLAKCLMTCGRPEDAWKRLATAWRTAGARMLELTAEVADRTQSTDAPELWQRLVTLRPSDPRVHFRLAQARFHLHDGSARDAAWSAFETWRMNARRADARVTDSAIPMLGLIGRILLWQPSSLREANQKVGLIINSLRGEFPGNSEAERVRFLLASSMGEHPADLDVPLLVDAGVIRRIPAGEVPRLFEQIARTEAAQWRLYAEGGISLAGLSRAQGEPFFATFLSLWQDPERYFCAPNPTRSESPFSFDELELVVGPMELFLLAELGLFEPLDRLAQRYSLKIVVLDQCMDEIREQRFGVLTPSGAHPDIEKLSETVSDWLNIGWIERVRLPSSSEAPELPPLRPDLEGEGRDKLLRAPLQERLMQAAVLRAEPVRRRILSIDHFATTGIGNVDLSLALAWPSPRAYQVVTECLEQAGKALTTIPELIRAMTRAGAISELRRRDLALELARRGFGDALTSADIIAVTRMAPRVSANIFDGLEAMIRTGGRFLSAIGRVAIAGHYSSTIGAGALGETKDEDHINTTLLLPLPGDRVRKLPNEGRTALIAALLSRLENLDTDGGDALGLGMMFVALLSVDRMREAFSPSPDDATTMRLDKESPVGELWSALGSWAGDDGTRRTVLDRAVCSAWVAIDHSSPEAGPGPRVWPLFLHSTRHDDHALSIAHECVAILSANWVERPLRSTGMTIEARPVTASESSNPTVHTVQVPWESVLEFAAEITDVSIPHGDGRTIPVDYDGGGLPLPYRIHVPVDAVVLRMPSDRVSTGLAFLLVTQGAHDGIAYEKLKKLEQSPNDQRLRRSYARYSADAPWRRVRDDPEYLLRWTYKTAHAAAPSELRPLCRMLHEPNDPIEHDRASGVLKARMEGYWSRLDDRVSQLVAERAATMPGLRGVLPLPDFADARALTIAIEDAVYRLENADAFSAGKLAVDIRLLSIVAARMPTIELQRGTIDLRERLPELLVGAIAHKESPKGAMALHETSLIRACGRIIGQALQYQQERDCRDYLWLTYGLHAWLAEQIDHMDPRARDQGVTRLASLEADREGSHEYALAASQLFNPHRFHQHGFEYRTAVLMAAFITGLSLARQQEGSDVKLAFTNPALERHMLDIAERSVPELPALGESWIDWPLPVAVPDLAAYWLLGTNPQRFFSSEPEHLIRRIQRWPSSLGAMREGERELAVVMARGLAFSLDTLPGIVADAFAQRLSTLSTDDATNRRVQWMGLSSAFARGATDLEAQARTLVDEHLGDEHAPIFMGYFLSGVIGVEPKRLLPEIDRLLAHAAETPSIRATVILALARVVIHAKQPGRAGIARAALESLAQRPEFCDDKGLKTILEHLPAPSPS
jgi:tetratricopeptide (TPR) repeat protein/predicted amidohydrolase